MAAMRWLLVTTLIVMTSYTVSGRDVISGIGGRSREQILSDIRKNYMLDHGPDDDNDDDKSSDDAAAGSNNSTPEVDETPIDESHVTESVVKNLYVTEGRLPGTEDELEGDQDRERLPLNLYQQDMDQKMPPRDGITTEQMKSFRSNEFTLPPRGSEAEYIEKIREERKLREAANSRAEPPRTAYQTSSNNAQNMAPAEKPRTAYQTAGRGAVNAEPEDKVVAGVSVLNGYDYNALADTGHASTVRHKLKSIRRDINKYAADYYRIMLERFDTNISVYNNNMMPFRHEKDGTTHPSGAEIVFEEIDVKIKFSPYSLVELDEKGMTMTMVGEFWLIWSERMLEFQQEEAVWTITVNKDMVWTPPIIISNGIDGGESIGSPDDTISLTRIGYLQWRTKVKLTTTCNIIVTNFPFDTQRCDIVITPPPDMSMEFILWGEDGTGYGIDLDKYSPDGSWDLVGNNTFLYNTISDTKNLELTYSFLFRRRPMFYIFSTILPVILLSLTAALVFVLPVDAGEKMGTGITIVLAYAVYLTIVSDFLPDSSVDVCIISVYLILLLGYSSFGVVCSAFLLRLYHKPDTEPIPKWVRSCTRFLQIMLFMKLHKHINPERDDDEEIEDETTSQAQASSAYANPAYMADPNDVRLRMGNGGIYDNFAGPVPVKEHHLTQKEKEEKFENERHDMTWVDVAKTLDWFFYILFSVLTFLSTVVCFAMTYFDLMEKEPDMSRLQDKDEFVCDAIEYNIQESGRTQWQNYDKIDYPYPLCYKDRESV